MTPPAPDPRNPLEEADSALEEGDLDRALNRVGHCLRSRPHAREAYDLAARILEKKGSSKEGLLFRLCHDNFESPRHFYDLGFHFMAADLPHMARPILSRAFDLGPDNPNVRVEYAVALAETGSHDRALDVLKDLDPTLLRQNPGIVFLHGWCRLLSGQTEEAGQALEVLDRLQASPGFDPRLRERLGLGFERARAVGRPDPDDLAAWHFIQYGGVVLSQNDLPDMGGRYGVIWESYEEVAGRLASLLALLKHLEVEVTAVITPGGKDAEVLGRAVARHLHIPRRAFVAHEAVKPGTLFCAASPEDLVEVPFLARCSEGLLAYAHRLCWTRSAPLTPDVVGLMAQAHFFPWNRALSFDSVEKKVVERSEDRRPPAAIAGHLADLIPDAAPEAFLKRLDFFHRHRALTLMDGDDCITYRPAFRQESPVKSNRFL